MLAPGNNYAAHARSPVSCWGLDGALWGQYPGNEQHSPRPEPGTVLGPSCALLQGERERGAVAAAQLRQVIAPFFLRREKSQVFGYGLPSLLTLSLYPCASISS